MNASNDKRIVAVLTKDLWDQVKRAKNARDDKKYERAQRLIDDAKARLDELWEHHRQEVNKDGANATQEQRDLVAALAEVNGVRGGILRSRGAYELAIDAYEEGLLFEKHAARKLDNSYNLVQRLVNRILLEPASVSTRAWTVKGVNMHEALKEAETIIEQQINGTDQLGGTRQNDPWAACDLLFVRLLRGNQDSLDVRSRIEDAWNKLERTKPKDYVYESNLRVTKELIADLEKVPQANRSHELNRIIADLRNIRSRFEKGYANATQVERQ